MMLNAWPAETGLPLRWAVVKQQPRQVRESW